MDSALSYLLYGLHAGHSPEFCHKPMVTTSYLDLKKTDTTDQEYNPNRCCNSEQPLHWRDLRGEEKSAAALPATSCTV